MFGAGSEAAVHNGLEKRVVEKLLAKCVEALTVMTSQVTMTIVIDSTPSLLTLVLGVKFGSQTFNQ